MRDELMLFFFMNGIAMTLPRVATTRMVAHHGSPTVTCSCSIVIRTRLGSDVQLVRPSALRSPICSPFTSTVFKVSASVDGSTSRGVTGEVDANVETASGEVDVAEPNDSEDFSAAELDNGEVV